MRSIPSPANDLLCDLREVTSYFCASTVSLVYLDCSCPIEFAISYYLSVQCLAQWIPNGGLYHNKNNRAQWVFTIKKIRQFLKKVGSHSRFYAHPQVSLPITFSFFFFVLFFFNLFSSLLLVGKTPQKQTGKTDGLCKRNHENDYARSAVKCTEQKKQTIQEKSYML